MKKVVMFPGQGSQYRGMGKNLFSKYKSKTKIASDILGYDLEELCLKDPNKELGKTQFTQPALYVVNAFSYYERQDHLSPDYLIGHSLGEYNALHAGGAFDFETGLKLVKKRGALMSEASGGAMAAVLGLDVASLESELKNGGYEQIDIANFNTPTQIVISGQQQDIDRVVRDFDQKNIRIIPLFVNAPFHSRYMKPAVNAFSTFLKDYSFSTLHTRVISNATAKLYGNDNIAELLSLQIASPVRWIDTIRSLMGDQVETYEEIGSQILGKMVHEIRSKCTPLIKEKAELIEIPENTEKIVSSKGELSSTIFTEELQEDKDQKQNLSTRLGSEEFRRAYGVKFAYVAGAMYRGIASKELVVLMAKSKMLAFLGTGGMSLEEIEKNIQYIQKELNQNEPYGMNFLHNMHDPAIEMKSIALYLKYGIKNIEASAFMGVTLALAYYQISGLRKDEEGKIICEHKILAKVSRPEIAEAFMRPVPERIVDKLLEQGRISRDQAILSRSVPISHDICIEADSGGHTDSGVAMVLFPAMQRLRDDIIAELNYRQSIRIGLAGGIGTPQAVACSFLMGADFVMTGSINQCTVEAGISNTVKDLLQEINIQDTTYVPVGYMFEIGAKVQVLKKGVLFPARANKLYKLYQQYDSLEDIPETILNKIEKTYFKKDINTIWEETKTYLISKGKQSVLEEAERKPRKKMALVFRRYFSYSSRITFDNNADDKMNFQIHTGPALGAFNQWVKGTELESWKNRYANDIGIRMMEGAAKIMEKSLVEVY